MIAVDYVTWVQDPWGARRKIWITPQGDPSGGDSSFIDP